MPERASRGFGGDVLAISWQVAVAVGVPLFGAAWLSQQVTQDTGGQLLIVTGGLAVAAGGIYLVLRRYLAANPDVPTSKTARDAGRRWEQEIMEREREKEAGQEIE